LRDRWREGAPVRGNWFSLSLDEGDAADPLEEELLNRDRVRLLLNRFGILCRPLLEREALSWAQLLPAMRRMELAGELIAGRFFADIQSLQFASPSILKDLEAAEAVKGLYWMNAVDPASPAGLAIEGLDPRLPARTSTGRLYFRGEELIAVSNKSGKELSICISYNDPDVSLLVELFKIPRARRVLPEKKLLIETINGNSASKSEFLPCFIKAGFIPDRGKLMFW
jgi:ATP-dependent Lhr-like helicase